MDLPRKSHQKMMAGGLAMGAYTLWQQDLLLDYTIEVENKEFKVHKVVMASASDYFKVMLTGGMMESQTDRVRLQRFSACVVSDILNFIYTGELCEKSVDDLKELLDCAVYLQIPAAVEKCTHDLCDKVDKVNCMMILSTFRSYSLSKGIRFITNYMKLYGRYDVMSYDQIRMLMECWQGSEWDLFITLKKWVSTDYENRKAYINELMPHIRFCRMSPEQLASIKAMGDFVDSLPCHDLVDKALTYHSLPTLQKVLHNSEQTKCRREPSLVHFSADHTTLLHALYEDRHWQRYDSTNAPSFDGRQGYIVTVNNFVILCDRDKHCSIFDAQTLTWSKISSLVAPIHSTSLVHHGKHLYAFGGRQSYSYSLSDIIQRYNLETDRWQVIGSKLPEPMIYPRAFSISDSIYVLGGRVGGLLPLSRFDCFNPSANTWCSKAPVTYSRHDNGKALFHRIHMLQLFGETTIIILDQYFTLQYYKPSTNQWSELRRVGKGSTQLEWHFRWEFPVRILARENCLFLLNFKRGRSLGGCEKWTFSEKGLEKIDHIEDHPISRFCALLSLDCPYAGDGEVCCHNIELFLQTSFT